MEKTPLVSEKTTRVRNAAFKGYKDGTVEFLGDQIESLIGYKRQDFNSKAVRWIDLVVDEDKDRIRKIFVQALKGDKTYMREYRVRAKNGNLLWIREWSQIVCDDNGEVDFATGIIMDITEEKEHEMLLLSCERKTGKYLSFSMAQEEYGISILKVKEIIEVMPITAMPQAPDYVKGVINLRGKIIPVVDLRSKLGIRESENSDRSCIIVLETTRDERTIFSGIIVDSVSEVIYIKGADIEDIKECMFQFSTECILGMAKMDNNLKIILDVDKMMGEVDLSAAANF